MTNKLFKPAVLLVMLSCALLAVSCKKDKAIDNTFTLGKSVMNIDFSATLGEDGRYTAGISFKGPEKPLYYDFVVDDITVSAKVCETTLPAYQYFAWDFYEFESGTANTTVKNGWLTLVLNAKLSNGQNVKVRAKAAVAE